MMTTDNEPPPMTRDDPPIKAEAIQLAAALHTIVVESDEGETVRTALAALLGTTTGRDYIDANPLRY